MSRIKLILSYIFGFITSLLISILVMLFIVKYTVLDEKYIKGVLVKNNYYSEVYKGTIEEMKNYMVSSGLDELILDDIFSEKDIKRDINNYIDALYRSDKYEVDTSLVREKLTSNIDTYLTSNNVEVTNKKELELFKDDIVSIYKDEVTFYNRLNLIKGYINKGNKYIDGLIYGCSALILISIVILIVCKYKIISSALISSGLINLFIRLMIYEKIDIKHITIISDYFSESLRFILFRIGYYLLQSSILLIVVGLIILIIESLGKKEKLN